LALAGERILGSGAWVTPERIRLAAAVGAAVIWLWQSHTTYPVKTACLSIATMLANPFIFDST